MGGNTEHGRKRSWTLSRRRGPRRPSAPIRRGSWLLAAAGTDFDHVAKATCFLADLGDFAAVNEVYARSFGAHLPARSAVQVAGLPKGALVEVEVVAEVPGA